ncbi:uncharacterized protein LOC132599461 isoform X2 [Lycium barbarum]|uniref:uncharacterized protein LOC132599461 isoform X2 n=1 Tax=Lycium barbarum TaxID=112863 RepID=UPI00293F1548|nr:uncharacterized protein LOC132599461 isoform X2 [Lycium barbarum]
MGIRWFFPTSHQQTMNCHFSLSYQICHDLPRPRTTTSDTPFVHGSLFEELKNEVVNVREDLKLFQKKVEDDFKQLKQQLDQSILDILTEIKSLHGRQTENNEYEGTGGVKVVDGKRIYSGDHNDKYHDIQAEVDEQAAKGAVGGLDGSVPISGQAAVYLKTHSKLLISGKLYLCPYFTSLNRYIIDGSKCVCNFFQLIFLKLLYHSYFCMKRVTSMHAGIGEACDNDQDDVEALKSLHEQEELKIQDTSLDDVVVGIDKMGSLCNFVSKTPTLDDIELPAYSETQIVAIENSYYSNNDTPEQQPRLRKTGKYKSSPYVGFSSAGSSVGKSPLYFNIKHPFVNNNGLEVDDALLNEFTSWVYAKVSKRKNRISAYTLKDNKIVNPYDLGVKKVDKMEWFYNVIQIGKAWEDSHVDVVMYYLRKKAKYGPNNPVRYTTTDCFFIKWVEAIHKQYKEYKNDKRFITAKHNVAKIIRGFKLIANNSWDTVDNVLIPVNISEEYHWVLVVLCIKRRCFYVYDSFPAGAMHTNSIREVVERLATMIPLFFNCTGFYGKRNDINWITEPAYVGKSFDDPFEYVFVEHLP